MSDNSATDAATGAFLAHRELLFSIVYNMLGSVADTEDVLQETWLSWASRRATPDAAPIDNPHGYLVRTAINQALARRKTISRRRETYVGQWLPEPLLAAPADARSGDTAAAVERTESLSMALLVVLETLAPLERAVFVLHEAFGYPHTEIADMLGRSPAAVRQFAHRARAHVQARRPRYRADPHVQRQVTQQFLDAALGGDIDALLRILAPDVTLWTDGGGKGPATSLHPVRGRDNVARLLADVTAGVPSEVRVRYLPVNGDPSALLFLADSPIAVLVLDLTPEGGQVRGIYSITNPDKLPSISADSFT